MKTKIGLNTIHKSQVINFKIWNLNPEVFNSNPIQFSQLIVCSCVNILSSWWHHIPRAIPLSSIPFWIRNQIQTINYYIIIQTHLDNNLNWNFKIWNYFTIETITNLYCQLHKLTIVLELRSYSIPQTFYHVVFIILNVF